jgi:hypothetical protein
VTAREAVNRSGKWKGNDKRRFFVVLQKDAIKSPADACVRRSLRSLEVSIWESVMPLKGPNGEDERKLHAEINQIVNQRFILTTLALTIFGILIVLMVPKDTPISGANGEFPFAVSVILSLLLF